MRWKHKIPTLVVSCTNLGFGGLLAYLTWQAVNHYIDQPIATYVSYTNGDDNVNIEFPHIVLCSLSNHRFSEILLQNIYANASFDVENYVDKRTPNISALGGMFYWTYPSKGQSLQNLTYPVYEPFCGPSIGLDMSNVQIGINKTHPFRTFLYLELDISANTKDYLYYLFFHSSEDLPDAVGINPYVSVGKGTINEILLRKKTTTTDTTKAIPCGEFGKNTCRTIHASTEVAERFGCKIPFLYTGKHLEKYIFGFNDLPACNHTVMHDALKISASLPESCKKAKACKNTKYDVKDKYGIIWDKPNQIHIHIAFATFEVEHLTTYISYDKVSLMAELGGFLGMTLGFSFASIGYVIASVIRRHFLKVE